MAEIADGDGNAVALQIVFVDGSSLVCTVWTDWSLRIEHRGDAEIPDYFWPTSDYSLRPLVPEIPANGLPIVSVIPELDEVGVTIGVEVELDGHRVTATSFGGEIAITADGS